MHYGRVGLFEEIVDILEEKFSLDAPETLEAPRIREVPPERALEEGIKVAPDPLLGLLDVRVALAQHRVEARAGLEMVCFLLWMKTSAPAC